VGTAWKSSGIVGAHSRNLAFNVSGYRTAVTESKQVWINSPEVDNRLEVGVG
jgi:hypothetical protein